MSFPSVHSRTHGPAARLVTNNMNLIYDNRELFQCTTFRPFVPNLRNLRWDADSGKMYAHPSYCSLFIASSADMSHFLMIATLLVFDTAPAIIHLLPSAIRPGSNRVWHVSHGPRGSNGAIRLGTIAICRSGSFDEANFG
jgi:hypothetical protein